jgi:putative membrane protein
MFIPILIALLLGVIAGIITGLIPGIHVNLISVLLITLSAYFLQITSPLVLSIFIISLAITHSFLDSIPSIYLGAPNEAQALGALPGHRLLLKGQGHNAIVYTLIGSLGTLLLSLLLFPLFVISMSWIYPLIKNSIGYILIAIMAYMILKDKSKRLKSFLIFLLAGIVGILTLNSNLSQPLFPLLSGLFGVSILIVSLSENSTIPKQINSPLELSNKNLTKSVTAASGVGFIAAFLPGFSSSQAAIVATNVVGDIGDEGFLTLIGGINTANMLISIATIYALEKARNGAIVAVSSLIKTVTLSQVFLFLSVAIIVAGISVLLAIFLSKKFAKFITKVNYQKLILTIIGFITLLTLIFDGPLGFLVLLTATSLGLVAHFFNVGKNHLMGCLILPVILFFVL